MAPSPTKKGLRIGRALRYAAFKVPTTRLPRVRMTRRNAIQPHPGEVPIVILRVQVFSCKDLLAKDKNGKSDPFVTLSFLRQRFSTPVIKRNINPTYENAVFEFPLFISLAERMGSLEMVVWDKDMLKKEYLGEVALPLEEWFKNGAVAFDDVNNLPITLDLVSTRTRTSVSGSILVKLGFVPVPGDQDPLDLNHIYSELVRRSKAAETDLLAAPPTRGIGTIRSTRTAESDSELEDDGLSSDDEEEEGEGIDSDNEDREPLSNAAVTTSPPSSPPTPPIPQPPSTPTLTQSPQTSPTTSRFLKPPLSPGFLPKRFPVPSLRRPGLPRSQSTDGATTSPSSKTHPIPPRSPTTPQPSTPTLQSQSSYILQPSTPTGSTSRTTTPTVGKPPRRPKFPRSWKSRKSEYNFTTGNDIMGIVMLEVIKAEDLPKLKNMTRTGWDMDPFAVISFGKKIFRTRVIRHSLNPIWDEKMLFHVRRYEKLFKIQFAILDWDKLTSNDHVGDAVLELGELMSSVPKPDEETGIYPEGVESAHGMQEFKLRLVTGKEAPWESKHTPFITIRAKYQPYDALRQRFWRQCLKQYDTDDAGTISNIEITSMLDSLGSTLTPETINKFFSRFGKNPLEDVITIDQAIQCLEEEVCRPHSEKKRISMEDVIPDTTLPTPRTPALTLEILTPALEKLDFTGPSAAPAPGQSMSTAVEASKPFPVTDMEPNQQPITVPAIVPTCDDDASPTSHEKFPSTSSSAFSSDADEDAEGGSEIPSGSGGSGNSSPETTVERVINIKTCPLCHRPRLNSKAEMDIVTHLAVCASQDWAKVDRIVVGNFVTASQAQRKWYTRIITKVSSGAYQLGANSANIIVQNRMTGQLEEEKMQGYVRIGIRLLYKGAKSRMEGGRARRLLKSLSIKQGIKYDSPESAREIPIFIAFHRLNVKEIRDPISSYKTFNSFFYRKLKDGARPVTNPDDPSTLVSPADCRMMAFESVTEATRLWIKGREFTVARLLGEQYADQASKYTSGALAIFRLAPQDYHRFHSPVDGRIGHMTFIPGEYYTVNPQAIRTTLDVYGENARKIVPIDSPTFGRVMAVCIGAMMVGSILTTVNEGDQVARGQEFGYFAFGGSTIVLLFEKGVVQWDEDLLINGRASLETLVRMGMGIGKSLRPASPRAGK